MNFGMFIHVCMYVHVCVCVCVYVMYLYVCVYHTSVHHACFRSTSNTTENGLHHAYETKAKTAS